MKREDATCQKLIQGGLTVKSSSDVKSGKYLVRQVVRDSEGSQMAALNGAVDIPSWGGRRALAGKDSND